MSDLMSESEYLHDNFMKAIADLQKDYTQKFK